MRHETATEQINVDQYDFLIERIWRTLHCNPLTPLLFDHDGMNGKDHTGIAVKWKGDQSILLLFRIPFSPLGTEKEDL